MLQADGVEHWVKPDIDKLFGYANRYNPKQRSIFCQHAQALAGRVLLMHVLSRIGRVSKGNKRSLTAGGDKANDLQERLPINGIAGC